MKQALRKKKKLRVKKFSISYFSRFAKFFVFICCFLFLSHAHLRKFMQLNEWCTGQLHNTTDRFISKLAKTLKLPKRQSYELHRSLFWALRFTFTFAGTYLIWTTLTSNIDYFRCLVLPLYQTLLHRDAELSGFYCLMHKLSSWRVKIMSNLNMNEKSRPKQRERERKLCFKYSVLFQDRSMGMGKLYKKWLWEVSHTLNHTFPCTWYMEIIWKLFWKKAIIRNVCQRALLGGK